MKDGFDDIIQRYGSPHLWTKFEWWINTWRLIGEWIEIRVIVDMAVRCPDEKLRTLALGKLRDEFEAARLDGIVPGKGCFEYDWASLTKQRLAAEEKEQHDAANREDAGPVDVAHHEGGGEGA